MKLKATFQAAVICVAILGATFPLISSSYRLYAQEGGQNDGSEGKSLPQQLIGTWSLEEASTPGSPSGVGARLKMFTGTHWCIIQPDAKTGVIVFQHGGRYELDGDTLKTTREFAGESTKSYIGTKGAFKITVDGDTMKQADAEGVFNETWKRIK